jgi:hypothetical protein
MRIIKEINKGSLKITVFKYQEKISIKFEKDINEIIIKFRDGSIEESNIDTFLSDDIINKYESILDEVQKTKVEQLFLIEEEKGFEFPEIV